MDASVVPAKQRGGARELARRAMTAQVAELAIDLFLENGYEQTTIDDICAAAGISRSTFFRYFPSKEDVFLSRTATVTNEVLDALRRRPDDEPPWLALRHALVPLINHYAAQPERARRLAELARTTPALAARRQQKPENWNNVIAPELARRLGADPADATDPRPRALATAALDCLEAAAAAWIAGDPGRPLAPYFHRAMDAICSGESHG
jgi:AcrR family transcriptional regulator